MPTKIFKVAEARASFSRLLARAKEGEEIVIAKGTEPQARIVPPRPRPGNGKPRRSST